MSKPEIKRKPFLRFQRLYKLGGSYVVRLPQEWFDEHNPDKIKELLLLANRDIRIINPSDAEKIYQKLSKMVDEADTGLEIPELRGKETKSEDD